MWKKLLAILICLLAVAALGAGIWYGCQWYQQTYVIVDNSRYRRDTTELDLSGQTVREIRKLDGFFDLRHLDLRGSNVSVEDYDYLTERFPGCEILWEFPFHGEFYPLDTEHLQLDALNDEEVVLLDHLSRLQSVDAWDCTDYPQLLALQQRRPDCTILYYVKFGNATWSSDIEEITLTDADLNEVMDKLPLLGCVKKVYLNGALPERTQIAQLEALMPNTGFEWEVTLDGQVYPMTQTELDLSGNTRSAEEIRTLLDYFPDMQTVNLRDCGLTQEESLAICNAYPDCFFLWDMSVCSKMYSTEAELIDISGEHIENLADIEAILPYFPKLKKMVMCGCGPDSEAMESLNQKYPDVQFVWSVDFHGVVLRTDSTYFIPVKWHIKVNDEDLIPLKYFHDMVSIDLGHQDVSSCEWAAEMPHLRYLLLADTDMADITPIADHKELVYLELFQTKVRDVSPLVSCTALEDINMCYTYTDPEPLTQMPWLKRVWWAGNWKASNILPKAIPDAEFEFSTISSTGNGWRDGYLYYEMRDYMGMWYMTG